MVQTAAWTAFALMLCLGLAAPEAAAQTGTLQGTVTDADTGLAIEGAMVFARPDRDGEHPPGHRPLRARTGVDGTYLIEEAPAGDYLMYCGMRGYYRATAPATVVDGQATVVDFALEPLAFGAVTGVVTDAVSGLPIVGARVALRPPRALAEDKGFWMSAVTDDNGVYLIENALAGEYEIFARAYGYHTSDPVPVTVVDGETAVVDLTLEPLTFGSLEGAVTDAVTGDPVAGARVMLRVARTDALGDDGGPGGWGWYATETDDTGYYLFEEVVAGDYIVHVWAQGYLPGEADATVVGDQTTVVDIALELVAFGGIEGTVTDSATGDPIEGAWVMLFPRWRHGTKDGEQPEGGWHHAVTDASGWYSFEDVIVGNYTVYAFARGYYRAAADAEVLADQITVVDLGLEPRAGVK
jgi:protocatechuate 3,4-dioxygenase beta subunit